MAISPFLLVPLLLLSLGCEDRSGPPVHQPPAPVPTPKPAAQPPKANAVAPVLEGAGTQADAGPPRADAHIALDYPGPWFLVTARETGVYTDLRIDRRSKVAWARNGGRLAVLPVPIKNDACAGGWYKLTTGGYVCGNDGTTDADGRKSKFTLKQPVLGEVLPYKYARNSKHGTPLYRSIPSPEQMLEYEPYLAEKKAEKPKESSTTLDAGAADAGAAHTGTADAGAPSPAPSATAAAAIATPPLKLIRDFDAGAPDSEELSEEQVSVLHDAGVPWWQQTDASVHEVTLDQLEAEGDGILVKRMVSGFYVAVDSTFRWNKRLWYKTTKGMIAPADRFWVTEGPAFKGVELDGQTWALPMAWVHGWRKDAPLYELDEAKGTLKPVGTAKLFEPLKLAGRKHEVRGKAYQQLADGRWISARSVRVTQPGPPPVNLSPTERWVDVNLAQQTLVVFEGTRPVYATLVSTGKSSKNRDKDHSTPLGEWRVREKHITTTMDGDGSAAGDLPYSIEDVPYVMYYHKAYALHGAFWHKNFGTQMSHGCVNLAPLDAKWLFFYTDPPVPHGVHGVWARDNEPSSRIVVHE